MNEPARRLGYTFAEYIALEENSEAKHEYLDGEIFAMSGGTPRHSLLSINLARALADQLEGHKPCRVYGSDLRIRVRETGLATYPDVSVVCGKLELDPENTNTVTNPVLLAEVLSPSTEKYDRQQKFTHYRSIQTLREYLLVSQDKPLIEHFTRNPDETWTLRDVRSPQPLLIPSLDITLSLDRIYRGVFED